MNHYRKPLQKACGGTRKAANVSKNCSKRRVCFDEYFGDIGQGQRRKARTEILIGQMCFFKEASLNFLFIF